MAAGDTGGSARGGPSLSSGAGPMSVEGRFDSAKKVNILFNMAFTAQ